MILSCSRKSEWDETNERQGRLSTELYSCNLAHLTLDGCSACESPRASLECMQQINKSIPQVQLP